jgi:hypothetical protein
MKNSSAPSACHVHHIVLKSEGGKDEPDNAIALCLTCHTDVHTKAPFTRRFTVEELKTHRENVYRLVREGKLPAGEPVERGADEMSLAVAEAVSRSFRRSAGSGLIPAAIRVLVAAAASNGMITVIRHTGGDFVQAGGTHMIDEPHNPRLVAGYMYAIEQFEQRRLIAPANRERETFMVAHTGFPLADELHAEGGRVPEE